MTEREPDDPATSDRFDPPGRSPRPPHELQYAPPYRNPAGRLRGDAPGLGWQVFQFLGGTAGGWIASAVVWQSQFDLIARGGCLAFVTFVILKASLGLALAYDARWRAMGAGILLSMPL